MSSPITGKDWIIATAGQPFCDRMTNLLSLATKLRAWFEWAFDSSGSATDDFKSMFLLPPGVIIPYYSNGSDESVKSSVLLLNGGDSTSPFWRLCDGTNSTPDLRGRVLIGAGLGTTLTVTRSPGASYGSESVTISSGNLPAHKHQLLTPNGKGIPCWSDYVQEAGGDGNPTCGFANARGALDTNPSTNVLGYGGAAIMTENQSLALAAATPIDLTPPSFAVYHIIRTSRTQ